MAESSSVTFAGLLRDLRRRAGLTQEELAAAAGLSLRAISDLERGAATTPQRETVRLLADALRLIGSARARFESVARGRPEASEQVAGIRTLPRDVASFTGRRRELDHLLGAANDRGGVVGIHAIGGMAGVGKTAFAVHAAHRLADRFPAGQIFLPLHGHTPGRQPVEPSDALAGLLLTAGVAAAQIPANVEARAGLWRDRMAGRRLLLILDDAVGSDQVLPLLPGSGGALVLITSRRHLSALDDATSVSLDTLPPDDAAVMLVRLAGRPGLGQADPAVAELIRLCGFLPLAIGMVARQLHHHQAWSAAGRAAELAAARDRLGLMATENLSVTAAFDLSYDQLTGDQQRLFRRLGLHPGADIDHYAAAALDDTDLSAARRGLEDLYDHYLLTELSPGRYRMHDLIREHARTLAARDDPGDDRDGATDRLLDYYQHAAARANAFIAHRSHPVPDGASPVVIPALADREQALAWARAERASLLACLDHVARTGQHARVVALTAGLSGLLRDDGPWADAIAWHTAALQAARHLGERLGEATALTNVGTVLGLTGDYPAAVRILKEALGIHREIGSRFGGANTLMGLGDALRLTSDYRAAAQAFEEALGIYREIGSRFGEGNSLRGLGDVLRLTGDYPAAARALEEAIGILREIGSRTGEANALTVLGYVRDSTGDYRAAARAFEDALGINRELDNRLGEANALGGLGEAWLRTGDYRAAIPALEEALAIQHAIGNRLGEANAGRRLGGVWVRMGDYRVAARFLEEALGIYREIGNRFGEANALSDLGTERRLTGDYPAAARLLEEALAIQRAIGYRRGEATVLNEQGTLQRVSGELAQAQAHHQQALELARAIGSPWDEAHALVGLGRCALSSEDVAQASIVLRLGLEIFQRIGAAEAADLRAELEALPGPRPEE